MMAASTMASAQPYRKVCAAAAASSCIGASKITVIAANAMANAPFGQAVQIQNSSTATSVNKIRTALTIDGSQSGTRTRATLDRGAGPLGFVNSARPSNAAARPVMALAE